MEAQRAVRRTDQLSRRHQRTLRWALFASVLLHVALLLVFRDTSLPPSPFAAAGPRAGDEAAAAGGGMQAVQLQPQPLLEEIPRPPEPILVPDAQMVEMLDDPQPEVQPVSLSDLQGLRGDQQGPDEGPGREDGTGAGDGGTADRGRFRVVPPSPRGLILPPSNRPRQVRGKEVEVWVYVTETGRVIPDSTRLSPPTGDSRFDRRLRQQAAEWVFEPAKRGGRAIGEWFQYVVTL